MLHNGQELAEEGVGFGVPILKRTMQTVFPGNIELAGRRSGAVWEVTARFGMNLVERLARPGVGTAKNRWLYAAKDLLSECHRRLPPFRSLLTLVSNGLRRVFGWETTYEEADFSDAVTMSYNVDGGRGTVHVVADMTELARDGLSEVVIMNEQGARSFDRYHESGKASLHGRQIGSWDKVAGEEASFISDGHGITFTLRQVDGARLFRGRELEGSRLAWSGFGYCLPAGLGRFAYDLRIERIP